MVIVPFGRYKGQPVSELLADTDYYQYCLKQCDTDESLGRLYPEFVQYLQSLTPLAVPNEAIVHVRFVPAPMPPCPPDYQSVSIPLPPAMVDEIERWEFFLGEKHFCVFWVDKSGWTRRHYDDYLHHLKRAC